MNNESDSRYIESCGKMFWQKVFHLELEYLLAHLKGTRDILSVGCGPATIEGELGKHGFRVTGVDPSSKMLKNSPLTVTTVVARIEDTSFPDNHFDAVIFVASLEFIDDYRTALEIAARVLRPRGRLIAMLLNPASQYFKEKVRDSESYIAKVKHTDLRSIEEFVKRSFQTNTEYFLRIDRDIVSKGGDENESALFVIQGTKLPIV